VINEIMANPHAVPDERGEWIELRNLDAQPAGTCVAGRSPRRTKAWCHGRSERRVCLAGGVALLARDADGVPRDTPVYIYGSAVTLGNNRDWVALRFRMPDGRLGRLDIGPCGSQPGASQCGAPHA
jgi:hypothetical protein